MSDSPRAPLTRDRIVGAAVALADAEGLAGLSMRKVARDLGFEVMSLYNHVANKNDLVRAMLEHVTAEVPLPSLDDGWRAAVRRHSIETKEMFERHRWAVTVWVSTLPGPVRFDHMEWLLATIDTSGLDDRTAHDAFHAITNHVVGFMLANVSMPDHEEAEQILPDVMAAIDAERHAHVLAHIDQHLNGDSGPSFEFVLDVLIEGIAGSGD